MTTRFFSLLLIATLGTTASAQIVVQAPEYTVEKFEVAGEGAADYITAEPGTGRVFITRQTRVVVVEGRSGNVLGEIPNTPRVRGVALALKWNRGFTTNAGDSTVTMFDLQTLAVVKKIRIPGGGLGRIMYDGVSDRVVLTNSGRPKGNATVIDPKDGTVVGSVTLDDPAPQGAVGDDRGRIYVANKTTNKIQVFDAKTLKVLHSWPSAPCIGPTGIAFDARTNRVFAACSKRSVAIDASTGKVVSSWANGDAVDGLAWEAGDLLMYIPSATGSITVVRMISPNSFKVVKTIPTVRGARTVAHDPSGRLIYQFQPENGKSWLLRISR
jgi:DNA-binding beta-propeller fold protein YncE